MVKGRKLYQQVGKHLCSPSSFLPLIQKPLAIDPSSYRYENCVATGLSGGQADVLSAGREYLNFGNTRSTHCCCLGSALELESQLCCEQLFIPMNSNTRLVHHQS